MTTRLVYLIVFIEGFASLGAEIIALRRLIPHVGSSIVVTAPTIGFFLLALALGYARGGQVASEFRRIATRNFLIAAALLGIGLSRSVVDGLFAQTSTLAAYIVFVGGLLCPLAWLLGQTVPLLTNLLRTERAGEAAGQALYWSTLGSFLGSLGVSLVIMQWLGVWAAVLGGALLLCLGAALLAPRRAQAVAGALLALPALAINLPDQRVSETAYADYASVEVLREGMLAPRAFLVNNQTASLLDHSEPPQVARYVRHLRQILNEDLGFADREILVLGAGGFTLAHRDAAAARNRYTYVDIDPAIQAIAEREFLRTPIHGQFIVGDARRFIAASQRHYDAVVVDVFSALTAIPAHLVTREFWRDARARLKPDGVLLANLLLDSRLTSPYARNLLATLEAELGRCAVEVLHKAQALSNVIVTCHAGQSTAPPSLYVDERNRADLDKR